MELKPFELGWDQLAPVSKYWEVTQFMYLGLMDNFDDDNEEELFDLIDTSPLRNAMDKAGWRTSSWGC